MDARDLSLVGYWWDRLLHMILPVICLTYGSLAYLSRFVRGSSLEVIRQDYIRTARAKGLPEKAIVYRHVFRNTLIPVLTLLGLLLPTLISGSIILESIFSWPGVGDLFFTSVRARDYPVVMGLSFITAVLVLLSTLIADLLYAWADPRVTYRCPLPGMRRSRPRAPPSKRAAGAPGSPASCGAGCAATATPWRACW
jgi:peptide/nickel transport system permease protein